MAVIRTLCGQCGVGCGIRAITGEGRDAIIEGDPMHPANNGRLCPRGVARAEATDLDGRLLQPMIDGRPVRWDRAIAQLARKMTSILAQHGPGSIALHVGDGLLTEDYYVANKLMKGFIGSAHIDAGWQSAAARAQHGAYGEDVMPVAYEDIDQAELILLIDARTATDHPVLAERLQMARKERGAQLILLTASDGAGGIEADRCLGIPPDSAAQLIAGLLLHCHDSGAIDADYLARHVAVPPGFWSDLRIGRDVWSVARSCHLSPAVIRDFYEQFVAARRSVTLFDDGRSAEAGLAHAIINLHLATGRLGKPGAGPFAMTSAPNGMGGREVGCEASSLAAHRDFSLDARAQVARLWAAERMADEAGLAGEALLRAVHDGRIQALWSMTADVEEPDWLRHALARVALPIRSSPWAEPDSDRRGFALPSASWMEKDGTITGPDRLISRQRRLFSLPGESRPDWWIVTRLAQAMGWRAAFHYERPAEIYREHVRLTAYGNDGERLLNLRRHAPISNPAYDELTPWRWGELPFDEGRFPTTDGRARLLPLDG